MANTVLTLPQALSELQTAILNAQKAKAAVVAAKTALDTAMANMNAAKVAVQAAHSDVITAAGGVL